MTENVPRSDNEHLEPKWVASRLRFAMKVLDSLPEDQQPLCTTKDAAEAVAELMRLAECAADMIDPEGVEK